MTETKMNNTDWDYEEDEDEETDGRKFTKNFSFPPKNPIFKVSIIETRDENERCLETEVAVNEKNIAKLGARVFSIRADVSADRLFLQTLHSNNNDSFSVFCFKISSGEQLWQIPQVVPKGSLYVNSAKKTLEVGLNYGYKATHLLLLDYDGNTLERNYENGQKMLEAANEMLRSKKFKDAKTLLLKALETKVSETTKIKVCQKLIKIGELTNDEALSEEFRQQCIKFENIKQKGGKTDLKKGIFPKRTEVPPTKEEELAEKFYWSKRSKQNKEDGGE